MKILISYLLAWIAFLIYGSLVHLLRPMPEWYPAVLPFVQSAAMGGLGGVLYCLRATYLHCCFHKDWDDRWLLWYYLRPVSSVTTGFVSFFFLKAGLLVLNAKETDSINFGYYALAFVAGYNVDSFLKKLEGVVQSVFGIEKSNQAKDKGGSDGRNSSSEC